MSCDFSALESFSQAYAYEKIATDKIELHQQIKNKSLQLNVPILAPDICRFIFWLMEITKPQKIFEFGSGVGASGFWWCLAAQNYAQNIILSEKRADCIEAFHQLPWPVSWKRFLTLLEGDATLHLQQLPQGLDFVILDGTKAQYIDVLYQLYPKMRSGCTVAIDNAYWRGASAGETGQTRNSTKMMQLLHERLAGENLFKVSFLPVYDGLLLLNKR